MGARLLRWDRAAMTNRYLHISVVAMLVVAFALTAAVAGGAFVPGLIGLL
jgi:hypothetical protein